MSCAARLWRVECRDDGAAVESISTVAGDVAAGTTARHGREIYNREAPPLGKASADNLFNVLLTLSRVCVLYWILKRLHGRLMPCPKTNVRSIFIHSFCFEQPNNYRYIP